MSRFFMIHYVPLLINKNEHPYLLGVLLLMFISITPI